ncbi:MAG: hypothetical protein O3A46_07560 [Candidatus Poribacteria bacterium]|nr:hypothetical protein [Candidatus Poribacteria bacterium]
MERRYPYTIEMVDQDRVSIPRTIGHGVILPEIVAVDVPLYRKAAPGLLDLPEHVRRHTVQSAIDESKILAYDKFLVSLRILAEDEPDFPLSTLERYESSNYVLLVPPDHWNVLRLQTAMPSAGRSLHARFNQFEFEILAHPRLGDDEAFLIVRDKYRLYLYVQSGDEEVSIYRSEFLDRERESLPPVAVKMSHLLTELAEVQQTPPALTSERDEMTALPSARKELRGSCPNCAGRLVYLSPDEAFCLDCDWDNLKILAHSAAYTE